MDMAGFFQRLVGWDTEPVADRIVRWIIRVLVIIMPVFFLPVGNFPQELNKAIIFNVLVWLGLVVCLTGMVFRRSGRWYGHPLMWVVGGFLLFTLLSAAVSTDRFASFVGSGGVFSTNAVSFVSYGIFFLLLVRLVRDMGEWRWLVGALTISETIAVVFGIVQGYGVHLLPWSVTQDVRFNLIASSSLTLAVIASLGSALAVWLYWSSTRWVWRSVWLVTLGLNVLLVMMSTKQLAVYIVLGVLFVYSVAAAWHNKKFSAWELIVPLCTIVILAIGLSVQFPQVTRAHNSTTLTLDQRSSAVIAWESVRHRPLWGSGPQTFIEDFQSYRPASFNDTANAGVRFNKSGSEWWGQVATLGVIVVLCQIVIGIWFMVAVGKRLYVEWRSSGRQWAWTLTVAVVWLGLWVVYFTVPFNAILYFLWWLWLGINVRFIFSATLVEKSFTLRRWRPAWLIMLVGTGAALVVLIVTGFVSYKVWTADYQYFRANELIGAQGDIGRITSLLEQAIANNSREPAYQITLAQGYATAAQLEATQDTPDQSVIQQEVQAAVTALKQARETAPRNAIVYEQTAGLYDGLRNLIGNVNDLAINAYSTLVELEPTNPMAFLNLGRAQFLQAQSLASSEDASVQQQSAALLTTALDSFHAAKSLQHDYYLADVNIGYVLEAQGDLTGAKSALEEAQRIRPEDTAITDALDELSRKMESSGN